MQVLCYNNRGQLTAFAVAVLYPVGYQVHVQGLLLEDIYLEVTEHVPGEEYDLNGVVIMMVRPVKGSGHAFRRKSQKWFSLEMFVSPEMFAHSVH